MQTYSIRQLASEFGVTARALRFYEDKGLLSPRRSGQTRIYSSRDRARLILVLRGKRLGFPLDDIKELLDLYDLQDGQVSQLSAAIGKFRKRIEELEQQRIDIEDSITELNQVCAQVEDLLESKSGEGGKTSAISRSSAGFAGPIAQLVASDDNV